MCLEGGRKVPEAAIQSRLESARAKAVATFERVKVDFVSPSAPSAIPVGDTVTLRFATSDPDNYPIADEHRPTISISPDNGKAWLEVALISEPDYTWVVPATLPAFDGTQVSVVGNECLIAIDDYYDPGITDVSDAPFQIKATASVIGNGAVPGVRDGLVREGRKARHVYTLRGQRAPASGIATPGLARVLFVGPGLDRQREAQTLPRRSGIQRQVFTKPASPERPESRRQSPVARLTLCETSTQKTWQSPTESLFN